MATARIAVVGAGTRTGLGRPTQTANTLSTLLLSGITLYEPSELVLSARAGTPLRDVESLPAAEVQSLLRDAALQGFDDDSTPEALDTDPDEH